jgi:hypothetical protein
MRPKDCIFCGNPAGSKEHVFLADLGGRRTNKGLLCGDCNQKFSKLDAELGAQLRAINGLIGVRSDHKEASHTATVTDPKTGDTYAIGADGRPKLAEPVLESEEVSDNGERVLRVRFDGEEKTQEWIANERKKGNKVERRHTEEGSALLDRALSVNWSFGGRDALREIARVALNFLAQEKPELARGPELSAFKGYVLGERTDIDLAGWGYKTDLANLPASPFLFGHRILLVFDKDRQEVVAVVSFFSEVHYVVRFCQCPIEKGGSVLYDIDPLAESPPDDVKVRRSEETWAVIGQIEVPDDDDMNRLRAAVERILSRAGDQLWRRTGEQLLPELLGLADADNLDLAEVEARLAEQSQRFLNLARTALEHLEAELYKTSDGAALVTGCLDALSTRQDRVVAATRTRVARQVLEDIRARRLTDERLRLLLEGGEGASLAGMALLSVAGGRN